MKSGIKGRLIWSYLWLIILTVVMFEAIILFALHYYYIESVKQTLRDQGTVFTAFHENEILEGSLDSNAPYLLQRFNFLVNAQVQLVDKNGSILADNFHNSPQNISSFDDVKAALSGNTGFFKGKLGNEDVLTVTQPIMIQSQVYGAIRMTTSLEPIQEVFQQYLVRLIGIGIIVLVIAFSISYFIANSITRPLNVITRAAEQMAVGKFSTRILKKKDDELGKLADTLNYMAEQVEKHEQLKNEFIASISHELRTPLTSVKGWAITLHSMSEDKFFKEGLEIITTESERLSLMLGDLLDLSSISSGKVVYQYKELPIKDLIQQVVTQITPRANRQGIQLLCNNDVNVHIKGDFNRLKQVLINLLDNSLKFTPSNGEIEISSHVNNGKLLISIRDSGEGIPPEEIQKVKEKFHKGKSTSSGTGLGLAICQEIVQAHQGTLHLKSVVGIGTTVEMELPLLSM